MGNWVIYAALVVGLLAFFGALGFLGVRILQGWRTLKRLRRHLGKELERLADLGEATADKVGAASDTAALDASVARLRVSLARLAVLRAALDEATAPVAAVIPRG